MLLQENTIDTAKSINYFLICNLFKKNMRQKEVFGSFLPQFSLYQPSFMKMAP